MMVSKRNNWQKLSVAAGRRTQRRKKRVPDE
jgi:hypothetical protein